jgi:hypothetical protein
MTPFLCTWPNGRPKDYREGFRRSESYKMRHGRGRWARCPCFVASGLLHYYIFKAIWGSCCNILRRPWNSKSVAQQVCLVRDGMRWLGEVGTHSVAPFTTYSESVAITSFFHPSPYQTRYWSAAITARSSARLLVWGWDSPEWPWSPNRPCTLPTSGRLAWGVRKTNPRWVSLAVVKAGAVSIDEKAVALGRLACKAGQAAIRLHEGEEF